ncbi:MULTISPECIES: hypothetical protein [unclassified Mycobacterium]|uniref:hypothetical protein n=1 Tax=unclassified Mycobacterium TaxID=2642494 RepID=UPI0012E9220E|nr:MULTISPECIES: hypothetical protein [unclassified Mycobacterium]
MPTSETSATDLLPDKEINRYGLTLNRASFEKLGEALNRISDAERSAEIAASTLRVF